MRTAAEVLAELRNAVSPICSLPQECVDDGHEQTMLAPREAVQDSVESLARTYALLDELAALVSS